MFMISLQSRSVHHLVVESDLNEVSGDVLATTLVDIYNQAIKLQRQTSQQNPILVHCRYVSFSFILFTVS